MSAPDPHLAPSEPPGPEGAEPVDPRPPPPRSCLGTLSALAGVLLGGAYVLNPTAGFLELIPDNLPGVGNLDEAGAAALLVLGLQYLLRRRR